MKSFYQVREEIYCPLPLSRRGPDHHSFSCQHKAKPAMSPIATVAQIYKLLGAAIPSQGPHDYGTLATAGPGGIACVRTVVLRGFDPEHHHLWINTNLKTQKVTDLRRHPDAEVCLWLARRNIQLRLRAEWRVVDSALAARVPALRKLYRQAWDEQPLFARKMYQRSPSAAAAMDANTVPAEFALLLGTLYRIDALRFSSTIYEHYLHERPRNAWLSARATA